MAATPFGLTTRRLDEHAASIAVHGELDLHTAPELDEELGSLVPCVTHVLVDLTGVSFLDSTALGVLTSRCRELGERGGTFVLAIDSLSVRRVFELTGLDRMFAIEKTAADAERLLLAPKPWGGVMGLP